MDRDRKGIWVSIFRGRVSFFTLIFFSLFGIIFISSSIQLILYYSQVDKTINRWEIDREKRLEKAAIDYILRGKIPQVNEPITIFNREREILFSNRMGGMGGMGGRAPLMPLKDKRGKIVGYISGRMAPFKSSSENINLINSLLKNLVLSSLISMAVSLFVSLIISRKISKSTLKIKEALKDIKGNIEEFTPSGSKEIVEIGLGVKALGLELKREEELRNQWLHDISHDLKTPLSALKLQFDGILDGYLSLDMERIIKNQKEILRLEDLIMSISDLMRVEASNTVLNKSEINGDILLSELKERFKEFSKERSINFNCDSEVVLGDYNLLFKALSNLIENAFYYSQGEGDIEVNLERGVIKVINPGAIIEDRDKIFDRLYRGDKSRNSKGSGIGLSIVHAIVKRHGWKLAVESENGINSFIITTV